jgi:hypothetical protein
MKGEYKTIMDSNDSRTFLMHELMRQAIGAPFIVVPDEYMAHLPIRTRAMLDEADEIEFHREKRVLQEKRVAANDGPNAPVFALIPLLDHCGKIGLNFHLMALISLEPPLVVGVTNLPEFQGQVFLVVMLVINHELAYQAHEHVHRLIDSIGMEDLATTGLDKIEAAARSVYAHVTGEMEEWADEISFGKDGN